MLRLVLLAAAVAVGTSCADSAAWHKNGDVRKDCRWVAEDGGRCGVRGTTGGAGVVEAAAACPRACGQCPTASRGAVEALAGVERRAGEALEACGLSGRPRPALVTCTDSYYGSSVRYWLAHSRRLGWSEVVVLALDARVLELAGGERGGGGGGGACRVPFFGAVKAADARGAGEDAIPSLTGLAKFWVSFFLASRGVAHVFSEMDVFHFGDALPVLLGAGWADRARGPALVAQRARRGLESNIGFYGVEPANARGPAVARLFGEALGGWRSRLLDSRGGDGAEKAVDQLFFNRLALAAPGPPCVRHAGVASAALLADAAAAKRKFVRNCSDGELPILTTFDADLVTAGSDMEQRTVVWHIHRPNKTNVVRQLLSETYARCCGEKAASLALKVEGLRRCKLNETDASAAHCRARYYLQPGCASEGVGDPDDRICNHLDATWLPRMAALGHAPRFNSSANTAAHTLVLAPD